MHQSGDRFTRQVSTPQRAAQSSTSATKAEADNATVTATATTAAAAAASKTNKQQNATVAREQRRQQRRRQRDMGKPARDAHDHDPTKEEMQPQERKRHVPALVRSLSKDIDRDEQRLRTERLENAKDVSDKEDDDDNDEDMLDPHSSYDEVIQLPPVKLRSVGYTTSEGDTGHANEDRLVVRSNDAFHMFAAIDGHGGHKAAAFLVDQLFPTLETAYQSSNGFDDKHSIASAIDALDKTFLALSRRDLDDSGACFIAVVLYWSNATQRHQRMVLNCGDCRAIAREAPDKPKGKPPKVSRSSSRSSSWTFHDDRTSTPVLSLSEDHSVSNRAEKLRVLEAGAFIRNHRIAGILEPFRSIGDLDMKGKGMKGWVIPTPEIREDELLVGRTTIVVATDGVWCVLSNQRAMRVAQQELAGGGDAQTAADAIADEAREMGSSDDISVIVVYV